MKLLSVALKRRIQGYPRQRLYDLFNAWRPVNKPTEKLEIIIEHFFKTTMTEAEQQHLLDDYRNRQKVA